MNVFVLCTGRCGSTTFTRACSHITNYTAAHESRVHQLGMDRVNYPKSHIEADHYLAWFLGKLDKQYGDEAKYVHLKRDSKVVAQSYVKKIDWIGSLAAAYKYGIMKNIPLSFEEVCRDQVETVNSNIQHFLKDKTHVMEFQLENAHEDWPRFWNWIGAEGNYEASLKEWEVRHNATDPLILRSLRRLGQRLIRAWRALLPK